MSGVSMNEAVVKEKSRSLAGKFKYKTHTGANAEINLEHVFKTV